MYVCMYYVNMILEQQNVCMCACMYEQNDTFAITML